MDNLVYFGKGEMIGFVKETELGPGFQHPIVIDGIRYASVDQYIGIHKAILYNNQNNLKHWQKGMSEDNCARVAHMSNKFLANICKRFDVVEPEARWTRIRDELMTTATLEKIKDKDMRDLLHATGSRELQYCDDHPYWGRKLDQSSGENGVGKCLMTIRKMII